MHAKTVIVSDETVIDAPAAEVWKLTLDVEAWPAMSPTFRQIRRLDSGPLGPGSRARVTQPGQLPRVWTVTTVDPPSTFAWETRFLGVHMIATHIVAPAGEGCRNTMRIELRGRGARLLGWAAGWLFRRSLAIENAGLKRYAEAAHSGRSAQS